MPEKFVGMPGGFGETFPGVDFDSRLESVNTTDEKLVLKPPFSRSDKNWALNVYLEAKNNGHLCDPQALDVLFYDGFFDHQIGDGK